MQVTQTHTRDPRRSQGFLHTHSRILRGELSPWCVLDHLDVQCDSTLSSVECARASLQLPWDVVRDAATPLSLSHSLSLSLPSVLSEPVLRSTLQNRKATLSLATIPEGCQGPTALDRTELQDPRPQDSRGLRGHPEAPHNTPDPN